MTAHLRHHPVFPTSVGTAIAALVLVAIVSACSASNGAGASSSASPEPSTGGSATSLPSPTQGATPSASPLPEPTGAGEYTCGQPISGVGSVGRAQIADVRIGTHDGYDRIVFDFDNGIPAYSVEIVTPPFTADPSGLPLDVAGSAFLRITLDGGTKVTPDGQQSYTGATDFTPGFDELVELIEGGDFEAVSTWFVGLATNPCLNVFTITDGARLVIDVEH